MLNKSILCGLFLLLWQSSFGQTVEGLYLEAAQNNPSLKVAYQEYLNSLQEIERIGPIDPTLNAGYFIRPMMMADGEQRAMFSLMQMFPWFGTLNSDRAMRNSMAEVRYQAFLQMANEVLFQMRSFLIERESAQIQLKSLNEKLILLENMQELARASIESGQGELAMVIKLNQQQDQMETEQLLLQNEIEELEIKLLLMAGRSPSDRPLDLKYDLPNWQEVDFADIELNVNPQWQALVAESKVYNQQRT
jgi:outer membrane protein TolC